METGKQERLRGSAAAAELAHMDGGGGSAATADIKTKKADFPSKTGKSAF